MNNLKIVDEYQMTVETKIPIEQLDIIDGYASITIKVNTVKDTFYLSGVIDEKLNTVVPFRYEPYDETIAQEELDNFIPLFDNSIGIYYANEDNIFVIDLKNTNYKRDLKAGLLPDNYIRKIDAYERVNHDVVNVLIDGKFYTYNPAEDKLISIPFDWLDRVEDSAQSVGYIQFDMLYDEPITVACVINKEGININPCIINKDIEASFSDDILYDRKKLVMASKNVYESIHYTDDYKENNLCKIMQ